MAKRVWCVVIVAVMIFISACSLLKKQPITQEEADQIVNNEIATFQAKIDQKWPVLVEQRQQCEASCQSEECSCLQELKIPEQEVIALMVYNANIRHIWKTPKRKYNIYYHWLPGDPRCDKDLKAVLWGFPRSYYTEKGELGLTLITHGQKDQGNEEIAIVLQLLYAEKEITDVQAYLELIQLTYLNNGQMNFDVSDSSKVENLPYFYLTQQLDETLESESIIFHASVYDQELFDRYDKKKFPWYADSITILIEITKRE